MKIGLDLTPIIYQRGVSRYTVNLTQALLKAGHQVSGLGYSFRQKNILEGFAQAHSLTQTKFLSWPPSLMKWWWRFNQKKVSQLLPGIEVFHSWDWLQPPIDELPIVSTIHDVAMLKFPQTAHPKILAAHQRSWEELTKRQAHIIAVSRATKKDIVNLLGIPSYLVHVVHEALPAEFAQTSLNLSEAQHAQLKDQLRLDRPYLLFVGTQEPRKNLARLIEAWQPLANDYQLIIAGEKGWDGSDQFKHPQLKFLGQVNDRQLAVLYAEAEVFCYPSLYEGFGLPILEAFFHGTPVLTSNLSSMPEVAGNAAELIDPEDTQSIHTGLTNLLNEDISAQRKRLQRMIIRLQMFNWERVAEETLAVYQAAILANHEKN